MSDISDFYFSTFCVGYFHFHQSNIVIKYLYILLFLLRLKMEVRNNTYDFGDLIQNKPVELLFVCVIL